MADNSNCLSDLCDELQQTFKRATTSFNWDTLLEVAARAETLEKASSGSWFGYHSRVYIEGLAASPADDEYYKPGTLPGTTRKSTNSCWKQYRVAAVDQFLWKNVERDDFDKARVAAQECESKFHKVRRRVLSILESDQRSRYSTAIQELREDLTKLTIRTVSQRINGETPSILDTPNFVPILFNFDPRIQTPPHKNTLHETRWINASFDKCQTLLELVQEVIMNMNIVPVNQPSLPSNDKIFIGHGQSLDWLQLEKFLDKELNLQVDEFNRIPIGGISTKERLQQMLESSCFAFLILTAEDEIAESKSAADKAQTRRQARMNVIHEAGLFQGKLGFEHAIILLENDCEEFTNIVGLGQIRFDKGKIDARFHEIRRHLEKAKIITK